MSDPCLVAVVGDDDYIVRQRAKEIYDGLLDDFPDDLSREIIDGRADKVESVEHILQEAKSAGGTLSLFGGGKLIWLNEINFLNQTKTGAAQGTKDALDSFKSFAEGLEGSKIIISACPVHRNHSFVKWLQKNSTYEDVAKQEKEDVAFRRLVEDTAKECGVSFARGAVDYCSQNWCHHGLAWKKQKNGFLPRGENGEITEELILELVPDYGEEIFEAPKPFQVNWNGQSILSKDIFHGKDARPLLATLQNRNRLLIKHVLIDGGELDPNQRLSKDLLEKIRQKCKHFAGSRRKHSESFFAKPMVFGTPSPLANKFSTRRLIDLQSNLIGAFEEVLAKEQHTSIFKNLVIQPLLIQKFLAFKLVCFKFFKVRSVKLFGIKQPKLVEFK